MDTNDSRVNPFDGSAWDPLKGSGHNEFANLPYQVVLSNQQMRSSSHFGHYPSDPNLVPSFGNESFSELVNNSFPLQQDAGQLRGANCYPNYVKNRGIANEGECQISGEGAVEVSPNGKRKISNASKNVEGEMQKADSSDCSKEQDGKRHKTDQNNSSNLRNKQAGKQVKEDSGGGGEPPKDNYVHIRAKRGQATNSHSLAERVRRERISERMRLLQELVPGCSKITGKAVMLDEIINYVQSLQQQVEFLSMKLATVNPEVNFDIDRILSKEMLNQQNNAALLGLAPGMSSSIPFPGISHGSFAGIPGTAPPFHPLPQNVWDNDLQSLLQMGFDSNASMNNMGQNGNNS